MVHLHPVDIVIIAGFLTLTLLVGLWVSKKSGKDTTEYFLSGRRMPWWLLGFSMVATTFATDTPNLVTDIVRNHGVSGNWVWWAFLLTGLLTVFVYARLWRISGVKTDLEFYELRYGGKPAAFLRMFRAVYLGLLFNVLAMAGVTLAAIKIGQILLGIDPWVTVLVAGVVTVVFSALGGFRGVVYTDFLLFFVAMAGSLGAALYVLDLPQVGGLHTMLVHPQVSGKLGLLPDFDDTQSLISILIIPLAVQWWSAWYPGAEPGGGGYIAQRMLAAKDENHAIGATFFFNFMHYALRPWPWILVALASLIVFPDLDSLRHAFPYIAEDKMGHDLAYPAMLTLLPAGLLGLVLASLVAAYMSTISTHLNWGSSYLVNDFYKRYIDPDASERKLVRVGRFSTLILMVLSALLALALQHALQLFQYILMFGAGTGLIFILRWFWWRINAWSEIAAMFASGIITLIFKLSPAGKWLFGADTGVLPPWAEFPAVVLLTTVIWLLVTYLTPPEQDAVLEGFYHKINPGGPGWKRISRRVNPMGHTEKNTIPKALAAMLAGVVFIYSLLFSVGYWIYGDHLHGGLLLFSAMLSGGVLWWLWKRIRTHIL